MANFVLTHIDKADSLPLRMATREAHLDYARAHAQMIRIGGPLLTEGGEMSGSFFILEAETLAAAQAFSDNDPYTLAGLFDRRDLKIFRATFGVIP
jgi:uncharacterized protein YciI